MKMKTIYEKPEAQLRPSVIRCSILAGSGNGSTSGKDVEGGQMGDARRRDGILDSGESKSEKNAVLKF